MLREKMVLRTSCCGSTVLRLVHSAESVTAIVLYASNTNTMSLPILEVRNEKSLMWKDRERLGMRPAVKPKVIDEIISPQNL